MRRLFVAALGLSLVACKGRTAGQAADSTQAAAAEPVAPPLRLTMANGQVFDLAEQKGKAVAIFFGYTHCPDFCPTTMADFASVKRRLGPRAEQVRFVFISVDPKRDTPERAQAYAAGFDRTFVGLSGDSASLADIQRGFRVASFIENDSVPDYTVGHSALVFVVNSDGRIANTLLPGEGRMEWLLNAIEAALRG